MRRLINLGNKRGQFYLIAAVVILAIFGGFIAVSNSVSYVQNPHIMDLKSEIISEASAIINYGTYNANTTSEINSMLINLSDYYADGVPDGNSYFLFGAKDNITLVARQTYAENVLVNNEEVAGMTAGQTYMQSGFSPGGNWIDIKINETDYNFTVNEGENFYLVVSSFANGQEYTVSG